MWSWDFGGGKKLALIANLPVALLFMLAQRFVSQGLAAGAVKG